MATTRPIEELSDRDLKTALKKASRTIAEIEGADAGDVVRSGKADQTLARLEAAIGLAQEAEAELARRDHRTIIERLPLAKQLRDAARKPHPAARWLDAARRFSAPELQGETLVADRLSEDDARELETIVKRKREIASDNRRSRSPTTRRTVGRRFSAGQRATLACSSGSGGTPLRRRSSTP
jgi:hypothetical protein